MPLTTVNQGLLSTDEQYTGFKNRIINGDMQVDQRNNGASVSGTTGVYTVDRWQVQNNSGAARFNAQQNAGSVTPPSGFRNYLGMTSTSAYSVAANDVIGIRQHIEGFNAADLMWGTSNAQTVTLSFWVRSSLTGTFGALISDSSGDTAAYPATYTISSANTWEQKSVTIVGPTIGTWNTTNGRGIGVMFLLGLGSNQTGTPNAWTASAIYGPTGSTSVVGTNGATFYVTGVQLEKGSTATSFDVLDYGRELMLCQRYLPAFIRGPANAYVGTGWIYNSTNAAIYVPFLVAARTNPTGVTATGVFTVDSTIAATVSSITLSTPAIFGTTLVATTSTTMTAGYGCGLVMLNSSTQVLFTGCEL